jgi:hypothetical protein
MKETLSVPKGKNRNKKILSPQKRRNEDRRKVNSDGYTYIPMVGWYCRREQTRRKNEARRN